MSTTSTVFISADHIANSGTVAYLSGTSDYRNLSDSSDSSNVLISGASSYALLPIYGGMPSDILAVTSISIDVRTAHATKGDVSDVHKLQIFKSDGTTAISSEITITPGTITTTMANYSFSPSVTLSGQASWNDACMKITTDSGTAGAAVYEVSVTIEYTDTADIPLSYTATGELTLDEKSMFKVIFDLVTITYDNNLNYNFNINAFKSRTILKSHMRIY